ncbi:MAG: DNA-3-methyladenine glycosylase [Candidatus Saccharimonadales bacterium]
MLPQSFFTQDAVTLAKALLGCELVNRTAEGLTAGMIVETEAYSQEDAASHSCRGETARTKVMFGPGGHAYVYFTYGMHYCFNVVSGSAGHGQAVLVRALEPRAGIKIMQQRRNRINEKDLCSGPAKLVQAMGITKADYGKPLYQGNLFIKKSLNGGIVPSNIVSGPRIGIKQAIDTPWRFYIKDSPFVSR